MAKKAKKAKPAKKAAKPQKKAAAKKPAKKTAKAVKKVVKKNASAALSKQKKKTAKKVVASTKLSKQKKKANKKPVAKKVVKAKKAAKPVKAKKAVKVKAIKKVIAKVKPVAKSVTQKTKAIPIVKEVKAPKKTALPKKEESAIDNDDDNESEGFKQPTFVYEPPKSISRPNKLNPVIPKPQINKDKRTRYSDKELQEFKQIIIGKLTEAQKDYELLKSTLSHKDDHGTDDTSPTFKLLEDGSDVSSKEETAHLAARQEKFIQNLQNALIRIENKSYGICRATGKLISKERLRSVPHATLSIDAKLEQAA